jgi:hypothetical protein
MTDLMDTMAVGLIRVVARNGTVWWVNPAQADFYANLTQDAVSYHTDNGYALYWKNHDAKGQK